MNTIAGKPLALALALAAGLLAVLFAMGVFAPRSAQAAISGQDIELSSSNAGAKVELTVSFTMADGDVSVGDQVVIKLKDFGVPSDIDPSRVLVRLDDDAAQPADVAVNGTTITVEIGDMSTEDGTQQPMTGTSTELSIIFRQRAGITNPTRSGTYTPKITVGSEDEADAANPAEIVKTLKVTPVKGARGTDITVSGVGYSDGSVSIYRVSTEALATPESDDDNPSGASRLSTALTSNGAFSATFNVDHSKFEPANGFDGNPDAIQAKDGDGTWGPAKNFHLIPTLNLGAQKEVKRGKELTIKLQDWGYGAINRVTVGGTVAAPVGAFPPEGDREDEDGNVRTTIQRNVALNSPEGFKVTVATATETGTQTVVVEASRDGDADALGDEGIGGDLRVVGSIDVRPAYTTGLTVTPSTAVVGQSVTIEGTGFTESDNASTDEVKENEIASITVGGATVSLTGIDREVAAGGRVVATFDVPDNAALASADGYTIQLKDGANRSAKTTLTIPQEKVTVTPSESRIGSTIEVDCTGFPTGSGKTINILYDDNIERTTRADGSGNCDAVTFQVPNTAGVGKSHTVTAQADVGGGDNNVSASTTHKTPKATVTLSATEANRGSHIWISGANFHTFHAVTVEIGNTPITLADSPTTDREGAFRVQVRVPGIALGDRNVKVDVNNVPVVEILTITDAPVIETAAQVFAPLGDALKVVWYYDNATQDWSFYNPAPAFAAAIDLTTLPPGNSAYSVQLSEEATFEGRTYPAGWVTIILTR